MNIENHKMGIQKKLLIVMLLPLLTSCATYNSSFACGDARGANCTSMDKVDRMISSGEIERFNESRKKCRGRHCKGSNDQQKALIAAGDNNSALVHFVNNEGAN